MDRKVELEKNLGALDVALESAEAGAVASLVRERRMTLNELASVSASDGRSARDEISARREARRAAAAAAAQAASKRRVKRSG